jgi:hypothetical protein
MKPVGWVGVLLDDTRFIQSGKALTECIFGGSRSRRDRPMRRGGALEDGLNRRDREGCGEANGRDLVWETWFVVGLGVLRVLGGEHIG